MSRFPFSLLPFLCVFCALPSETRICPGCREDLPEAGPACPRCAEPRAATGPACGHCLRQPPPWRSCRAVLRWEWPVDRALKALKFSGQLRWAAALGELLLPAWRSIPGNVDALCPVPLWRWRQARRGYNQALELARPLRQASGLPFLEGVRRVRPTRPQSGLDRRARRRNLRRAFELRTPPRCRHVLIVDDVMTTGETCRQLAATLAAGGVETIDVLVVARAADQAGGGLPVNV